MTDIVMITTTIIIITMIGTIEDDYPPSLQTIMSAGESSIETILDVSALS